MFTGFAKRQLEKCGWSEGEGIGKNKQGIVKPLKASLKFSTSGLGYDITESYSTGWWVDMFNASAKNIMNNDTGKKVKSHVNKEANHNDTQEELPSNNNNNNTISRRFSLKKADHLQLHKYTSFIKCETLPGYTIDVVQAKEEESIADDVRVEGGKKKKKRSKKMDDDVEQSREVVLEEQTLVATGGEVDDDGTSSKKKTRKSKNKRCKMESLNVNDLEEVVHGVSFTRSAPPYHSPPPLISQTPSQLSVKKKLSSSCQQPQANNAQQLNHEALFEACGGLTCHKAARHGLGLNGKLARIALQDAALLLGKTS